MSTSKLVEYAVVNPQGKYAKFSNIFGELEGWVDEETFNFAIKDLGQFIADHPDCNVIQKNIEATDIYL